MGTKDLIQAYMFHSARFNGLYQGTRKTRALIQSGREQRLLKQYIDTMNADLAKLENICAAMQDK